jgi:hypothetical protein
LHHKHQSRQAEQCNGLGCESFNSRPALEVQTAGCTIWMYVCNTFARAHAITPCCFQIWAGWVAMRALATGGASLSVHMKSVLRQGELEHGMNPSQFGTWSCCNKSCYAPRFNVVKLLRSTAGQVVVPVLELGSPEATLGPNA